MVTDQLGQQKRAFIVRRAWLSDEGFRLGPRTYAEGALAARNRIMTGPWQCRPLGVIARVFRGPLHKRHYVQDPSHGVPYLTASDVALSDPPRDARLSIALTPALPILRVQPGWTLISSAGTIGNTTYIRDGLVDFAVSQDMLRVDPHADIAPGFLFAYLSSAATRSMLRLRTYGSVVDRIEPKHVEDLPVPLPKATEQGRIHALVDSAAKARTEATRLLDEIALYFDTLAGPMPSAHDHAYTLGVVSRSHLGLRLDAFHHVGWAVEPSLGDGDRIDKLAEVISTNRVPRIYVERGVPFLSGIDVFRIRPVARVRLATHIADAFDARVKQGDLVVQGSGQRYGLVGRVAHIGAALDGWASSHDLFRIRSEDAAIRARIYAFLRSEVGHRAMLRHSYGTSIPHVNPAGIAAVRIPPLPHQLTGKAERAMALREQADADEERAIREVETWLRS